MMFCSEHRMFFWDGTGIDIDYGLDDGQPIPTYLPVQVLTLRQMISGYAGLQGT